MEGDSETYRGPMDYRAVISFGTGKTDVHGKGKVEDFNKMWSSFLTFMNNLNVQPRTGQDLLPPPL